MLKTFEGIFAIDFQSNEIVDVEEKAFSANKKLEKIDLSRNRLNKITKKMFDGDFDDLQEINLSSNLIENIASGAFDQLSKLESVDLSCNLLKHLHSDVFKKSSDLREVYLQGNEIAKIAHDAFSSKTELRILNSADNQLTVIPELELKKVSRFDLSSNKITKLDLNYANEKKKSASIVELILSFNQISECVELEERRTDILHLDVSHNELEHLDDFPSFLNLQTLILANNNLSDLSLHNFEERFPSLKVLNIRHTSVDCQDYKYVRHRLESLIVTVEAEIVLRCQRNNGSATDYDVIADYEGEIINEIRSKNSEIVKQLITNRSCLLVLMSMFAACAMAFTYFALQHRIKLMKRAKGNLIDQIEL